MRPAAVARLSVVQVCVLSAIVVFALELWLFQPILGAYFPTADDLAFVGTSTDVRGHIDPILWFTEGYHNYFNCDQEWPWVRPTTDFMRPLSNALYWVSFWLFGTNWSYQLLIGYAAHAFMVGLAGYIAARKFSLNPPVVFTVMVLAALNPAYWSRYLDLYWIPWAVQFPIYQPEVLGGMLDVLAFLAFLGRRFALFALVATASLLLKETAISVPASALLLVGCWSHTNRAQTVRNFLWLISPYAIWIFLRFFVYQVGSSFYVLHSTRPWILSPIRNLLLWPSGLYSAPLKELSAAIQQHDFATLSIYGLQLALNAAWWGLLAAVLFYGISTLARRWFREAPPNWAVALVFALGNLALVIVLQSTDLRYGYFWFALGPPAMFAALSHWRAQVPIAVAMTCAVVSVPIAGIVESFSRDSIDDYRTIKVSARQFSSLLGQLPRSVRLVYLVDDLFMRDTSPEYTAKLAGFNGQIIRVNSLLPTPKCNEPRTTEDRYRLTRDGDTTVLEYTRANCFYRPRAAIEIPRDQFDKDQNVKRGEWMSYSFPEANLDNLQSSWSTVDLGKHWAFRASHPECAQPGACIWVGLDPVRKSYYQIPVPAAETAAR